MGRTIVMLCNLLLHHADYIPHCKLKSYRNQSHGPTRERLKMWPAPLCDKVTPQSHSGTFSPRAAQIDTFISVTFCTVALCRSVISIHSHAWLILSIPNANPPPVSGAISQIGQ
ncbi:hypothetical protein FKM82_029007 [Ascaphus truei]